MKKLALVLFFMSTAASAQMTSMPGTLGPLVPNPTPICTTMCTGNMCTTFCR